MQARLKVILQHWQLLKFNVLSAWWSLKQESHKGVVLFHMPYSEWQGASLLGCIGIGNAEPYGEPYVSYWLVKAAEAL